MSRNAVQSGKGRSPTLENGSNVDWEDEQVSTMVMRRIRDGSLTWTTSGDPVSVVAFLHHALDSSDRELKAGWGIDA